MARLDGWMITIDGEPGVETDRHGRPDEFYRVYPTEKLAEKAVQRIMDSGAFAPEDEVALVARRIQVRFYA